MVKAVNTRKIKTYVLEEDRGLPVEEQTVFHYRAPNYDDQERVAALLRRVEGGNEEEVGRAVVDNLAAVLAGFSDLLFSCLVKIDNLKVEDEAGQLVDLEYSESWPIEKKKETLGCLMFAHRQELSLAIFSEIGLDIEESKN